ncbi:unnamed protein product [Adineta steineri]|uniref:G-protein coupled receptors family 1 profile domain-containing protein n=1 Tax=Adineta steineri TaxID=433720 RepID=A0A815IJC5_9BILA|nr:unnamed protein product [Adineta steineri]CAF1361039.1 unnamed protein product [Adineta steineri]CAF1366238.1 unnamed protein product [Adineta steineri]
MNLTSILIESWFIPIEIVKSIGTLLTIIVCTFFLCIILFDKTCHTVPFMLTANTCFSTLLFACTLFSISIVTIQNDLKQIVVQDSFCVIQCYTSYTFGFWLNYSFSIEAFYRYLIVIYPTRLFYQSIKFQRIVICLTWILGIIYPLVFLFTNNIVYDIDNQLCQVPLRISFSIIYSALFNYLIPLSMTMFIYFRLVQNVKEMSKRVTSTYILSRAQRELKMVQQTIFIMIFLVFLGIPYTIFILMSFFNDVPKYHFRVAYIFIDTSLILMMMILFQFNTPLKSTTMKRINPQTNVVLAMTIQN